CVVSQRNPGSEVVVVVIFYVAVCQPGVQPLTILVKGSSSERAADNRLGVCVLARYTEDRGARFGVELMQVGDDRTQREAQLGTAVEYGGEEPGRRLLLFRQGRLCAGIGYFALYYLRERRPATRHTDNPRCGKNTQREGTRTAGARCCRPHLTSSTRIDNQYNPRANIGRGQLLSR